MKAIFVAATLLAVALLTMMAHGRLSLPGTSFPDPLLGTVTNLLNTPFALILGRELLATLHAWRLVIMLFCKHCRISSVAINCKSFLLFEIK